MAITSLYDLTEKIETGGQHWSADFRKVSPNVTTAGIWFDYSMSPPTPRQNFYFSTALEAARLTYTHGIFSGPDPASDEKKYLKLIEAQCSVAPLNLMLCEYLLYYPGISGDDTAEEGIEFDNTTSQIQDEYADGEGVSAILVAQGSYTGGAQFFITYTNQDGVTGRISRTCTTNTAGIYGSLLSSGVGALQLGPFIPLQLGDTGIRSVQKINWLTANGGIAALVLVRRAGVIDVRELNHPTEKDFLTEMGLRMPQIKNRTYINFLGLANASVSAAPVYGSVEFVWG